MADDADQIPPPPPGFVRSSGRGAFSTHNGPYFHKLDEEGDLTHQAFYALPRHANGLGLVHGGMLTAFMDGLLAAASYRKTRHTGVTIHLSVDFLRMARRGEWLRGEARLTEAARDVAFAEGSVFVGRHAVGRATGVFKLMGAARPR